jgi:hypothetical protein
MPRLRMVRLMHRDRLSIMIDRDIHMTPQGQLDTRGRPATAGEVIDNKLATQIQNKLGSDHYPSRFFVCNAAAWLLEIRIGRASTTPPLHDPRPFYRRLFRLVHKAVPVIHFLFLSTFALRSGLLSTLCGSLAKLLGSVS